MEFDKSSEEKQLSLTPSRDSIPGFKTLRWDRRECLTVRQVARETESSANSPPSNEGSHSNTSVLDLGMAVPGKSFLRSNLSKTKGIPDRSKLRCIGGFQDFFLADIKGRLGAVALRRGEGSRGDDSRGESKDGRGLHGEISVLIT